MSLNPLSKHTQVPPPPPEELVLHGLPASPGIAIGKAYVFEREEVFVSERSLKRSEVESEITLLDASVAKASKELTKIANFTREKLDENLTAIFDGQLMILHDVDFIKSIQHRIKKERKNADFLVQQEIHKYKSLLQSSGNQAFQERCVDFDEVGQRLLRCLKSKRLHSTIEGEHIIIAKLLTPADTILFSKNDVLGYIDDMGGITSHTAILARSLNIPATVGVHNACRQIHSGDELILDGQQGLVIVHPTEETLRLYEEKLLRLKEFEDSLKSIIALPSTTPDGRTVELAANAELFNEVEFLLTQGASGIGLYRTETLYMTKGDFPTEQEQFIAYSKISHMIYPKKVIIRTFDVGGDKVLSRDIAEENPFLGWRGIRMLLDKPDLFKNQLRAILRASVMRNVKIMFPMISGLLELHEALEHLEEAKAELHREGVSIDPNLEVGIMIEVPSSVLIAEELAKEVDFFSIGTNDLIQYLLAIDRSNEMISDMYQEFHPAVVRAIRHVIDHGHAQGIWVGMCGEMAGNPLATPLLLGLGLDEFSVVPAMIPEVKKIIRSISQADAEQLASDALAQGTSVGVTAVLKKFASERYPELFKQILPELQT